MEHERQKQENPSAGELNGSLLITEQLAMRPPAYGRTVLAFAFDEEGRPKVIATFASHKDKFALLGIARVVIDRFTAEVSDEVVQPLLSGQKCL